MSTSDHLCTTCRENMANHHPIKSKNLQEIVDLHYELGLPLKPEWPG